MATNAWEVSEMSSAPVRLWESNKLARDLMEIILPIGIALSAERNLDHLLESILEHAKAVCNADGGTLYLPRGNQLDAVIMRNDSLKIAVGGATGTEKATLSIPLFEESGTPNYHHVATYVAHCGHSVHIPDIYQAQGFDFSGARAFDRRSSYRSTSTFTTPLKNHESRVIGVLQLINALDGADSKVVPFDDYMQRMVEALASQAAVVLNNRALLERQRELLVYEHELQIGQEVQRHFLPTDLPRPGGWELAARLQPARKVSGDFYDAFLVEGGRKLCFVIADVCDKGVGAALYMVLSRTLVRAFSGSGRADRPCEHHPVGLLNEYLLENHLAANMFVTMFHGMLDLATGHLVYTNCGHNPPVIIRARGGRTRLVPTGPAVGLMSCNIEGSVREVDMEPNDVLFAFTDGVTEARASDGRFFTEPRLLQALEPPIPSAATLLDQVDRLLRAHADPRIQFDDITMLAVRREGVTAP